MNTVLIDELGTAAEVIEKSAAGSKFVFNHCGVVTDNLIELATSKAKAIEFRGDCRLNDLTALNSPFLESLVIDSYSQVSFQGNLDGKKLSNYSGLFSRLQGQ